MEKMYRLMNHDSAHQAPRFEAYTLEEHNVQFDTSYNSIDEAVAADPEYLFTEDEMNDYISSKQVIVSRTIGVDAQVLQFHTKDKGRGRQALYVDLLVDDQEVKGVYIQDVYPNVLEHFQHKFYLREYCFLNEDTGKWQRDSGNGEYNDEDLFDNTFDLVKAALKGHEVEVEISY